MLFRRIGTAAVLTAAATAATMAFATSSYAAAAVLAPTTALQIRNLETDTTSAQISTSVGACNFLASGPSTSPSYTPFHIEGQATAATTRVVTSVELACQLRNSTNGVLGTLRRNLAGYASAVAGSINVYTFGSFQICTMVNVHYENGDESNNNEVYTCQWF